MARKSGGKCKCNPGWMILAAIIMAVGALVAVQGFAIQLGLQGSWGDTNTLGWILGYYFVGILLIGFGKVMKHKSGGSCSVHG